MGEERAAERTWSLRGLGVMAFGHGVSDFYAGIITLVIFFVVSREHLSPVYQGLLGFLWYMTSSIVQPFFGAYTDRHGRWWFFPAAITLTAVSLSVSGAVHSVWLLALCIVLGGIGSAVMHPEAGRYSAMLSGPRKAGGISIFQIGGQIGFSLGPLVVGILLMRFGGNGTLMLAVPGIVAAAIILGLMRRVDGDARTLHVPPPPKSAAQPPTDLLGIGLLVTSTGMRHFVATAFVMYLPNLLAARGSTIAQTGLFVSLFMLVAIVGVLPGGYLADRFGPVAISIVTLCGAIPFFYGFFALLGQPGFFGLATLSLMLANVLLSAQNAPGVVLVQAMLPRNLGMALGLMNGVAFGLGSGLVAATGAVVARVGAAGALEQVSAFPLVAALAYVVVARRLPRRSIEAVSG